ncbi:glycosyltransferase family 2 protein [Paenibacillus aquistagni]|uniref:glycosyltransferase family 2 protein n=1 Tax=Paenibacillus aquistagni TaxID=1852522 RepID=UPI000B503F41|nr:glycosyltransferase family 2 protein [Paenibacillus aquistagni]NMM54609.1 glycosyltransferase family 2 protein [Paenibacillus aquistagni]
MLNHRHPHHPKPKILVIVPAYNEEEGIEQVILSLKRYTPYADIVVINDGSTDDTRAVAERAGAAVLHLSCNLGIGGAVQTGYRYAAENGYDYAVQIDGDGQHNPADLNKLLNTIQESGADMVVGSRFIEKEGFQSTFTRKLGIDLLAGLVTRVTGKRITDPTSGYRLCGRRAIALFAQHYPTDYPEVEALVLLDNYHLTFKETPVIMLERQGGVSSISPLKSIYYMTKVILAVLIMKTKKKKVWEMSHDA